MPYGEVMSVRPSVRPQGDGEVVPVLKFASFHEDIWSSDVPLIPNLLTRCM
jgi:hypothetical protein